MVLTSRIAKNYELIIKSGNYNPDLMLSDISAALKRNRITLAEAEYLRGLVDTDMNKRMEDQLRQIGE